MISEWELWAVANKLIEQHGDGAREFATERQSQLRAEADAAGVDAWAMILARIEQLEAAPAGSLQ